MINRKLVMTVLGMLATARRQASVARMERVSTQWVDKLGRFGVKWL